MNAVQKAAISISICLALIVIFLQNPISGYVTENEHPFFMPKPCTAYEKQNMKSILEGNEQTSNRQGYTPEQIDRKVNDCENRTPPDPVPLPVSEWTSSAPHVAWLGSVMNLAYTLLTIAAMGIVVFYVFQPAPKSSI